MRNRLRTGTTSAIIANGLVFAVLVYAALLFDYDSDLYYLGIQEDAYLEWATFWAFLIAAVLSSVAAVRQHRINRGLPWFLAGVALFCLFVALEEISWGQRLFGYRPSVYFLDQNFQQEFNIHNVVDTKYRKLALTAVIVGYGVILPLLQLVPASGRFLTRFGVIAPPMGLLPIFLATYVLYVWYPWSHTGEWVEFSLGLGFLFAALVAAQYYRAGIADADGTSIPASASLLTFVAVVTLGFATAAAWQLTQVDPGSVVAVNTELNALKEDLESGHVRVRCGLHKRLYTFVREYDQTYLNGGAFSELRMQGIPGERIEFFLDPWNSPYWIRHRCASRKGLNTTFVYSLGPNRRRDSTRTEIDGDDIGLYFSAN
jgi:hypothetical protein